MPSKDSFGIDVLKYYIAQGVLVDHDIIVASLQPNASLTFICDHLPLELSSLKKDIVQQVDEEKLSIAWQYEKYNTKNERKRFCHCFDLSRKLQEPYASGKKIVYVGGTQETVEEYLEGLYKELVEKMDGKTAVQRIALVLHEPGVLQECHVRLLYVFLYKVVKLVQRMDASCVVFINPDCIGMQKSVLNRIGHLCDGYITLESFIENIYSWNIPTELNEYQGLCKVHKIPTMNCILPPNAWNLPKTYGIQRNRRKLTIDKLHLPPESSRSTSSTSIDF